MSELPPGGHLFRTAAGYRSDPSGISACQHIKEVLPRRSTTDTGTIRLDQTVFGSNAQITTWVSRGFADSWRTPALVGTLV